jgi:hypothetical protein
MKRLLKLKVPVIFGMSIMVGLAQAQWVGWGPDKRLTFLEAHAFEPRAAVNGNTVHLVWWEAWGDSLGYWEESFYKRSTDGGKSWDKDILLSIKDRVTSWGPVVAVNGEMVHVVWENHNKAIVYRRSTTGGETWDGIDTLMAPPGYHPYVAVVAETVYVVSIALDLPGIVFTKSADAGETWLPFEEIADEGSQLPTLVVRWPYLHIVADYWDDSTNRPEIFYLYSSDGGRSWSEWMTVSELDSMGSQRPSARSDSLGNPHACWYDYKHSPYPWTGDIFYRRSEDRGESWMPVDSLTKEHRAVASDILVEGNNIHVVWEDDRHEFNDNFEIYYRMSSDGGKNWCDEVRLTNAEHDSRRPSLVAGPQCLHLFWTDARDDSTGHKAEVYYKRKVMFTPVIDSSPEERYNHPGYLEQNSPNPFRSSTSIRYGVSEKTRITLMVYDVSGRFVQTLMDGVLDPGQYQVFWDGKDATGKEVSNGIYFYRLEAGSDRGVKKMLLIR